MKEYLFSLLFELLVLVIIIVGMFHLSDWLFDPEILYTGQDMMEAEYFYMTEYENICRAFGPV